MQANEAGIHLWHSTSEVPKLEKEASPGVAPTFKPSYRRLGPIPVPDQRLWGLRQDLRLRLNKSLGANPRFSWGPGAEIELFDFVVATEFVIAREE